MRIVDTHLHLVYLDKFSYPWLDGVPALHRQWDAETYFAEAVGLGIEAAIHMEVDVLERQAEDETRFALEVDPRVIAAVAQGRPERLDFRAHLDRLSAMPGVKGIRRLLQSDPDELSRSGFFRDNVRHLGSHGMSFELCVRAPQLPVARELAAACPDVQFILDHCGNPPIADGDLSQWRQDLAALAELPNVAGKVSGIINHAAPGWTAETLRPVVEHVIESFGWDRVVFGSDRPVLTVNGTLTGWVGALREIVSGASIEEQEALFWRNATRIYRL